DFKKSWMWLPIANEISNPRQAFSDFLFRDHFTIHADPFAKSDEVRGYEEAGPMFSRPANRIDHRANGAFAVRASDVNDARVAKIDIKRADQSANIFETEFDPEALKAVEPGERLFVGHDAFEK